MMESDSDDEVLLLAMEDPDGLFLRMGMGNINNDNEESEEPPRRRMRMDESASNGLQVASSTPQMTLRSGRSVQVQPCSVSLNRAQAIAPAPTPSSAADNHEFGIILQGPSTPSSTRSGSNSPTPIVNLPDSSSSESDNNSMHSWDSSVTEERNFHLPLSSQTSSEPDPFNIIGSPDSSHHSHHSDSEDTIYVDSDESLYGSFDHDNDSGDSFEPYDPDGLSDVPVNRSPTPSVVSASSAASESDEDPQIPHIVSVTERSVGDNSWQRRRLQRRNAVVLENTDSRDGGSSGSEDDPQVRNNNNQPVPVPDVPNVQSSTTSKPVENSVAVNTSSCDDEEAVTCLICYEHYTNSGDHRLCCLKCGHTYGKICIEKWIKTESRCPQCNAKATKKDIRILYVKNLKALDTAEMDRILSQLEQEKEIKRKLELECTRLKSVANESDTNYQKLQEEFRRHKERVGGVYRDPLLNSAQPSTSAALLKYPGKAKRIFTLVHSYNFKDGDCRVGAYDEWLNMIAVSQNVKSQLYPHGSYGIKRCNLLDMKQGTTTPLHQKEIRDMEFSSSQGEVILSVGFDKKAILTDCNSNVTIQCFNTESPLWSCAWSKTKQYVFYTGTASGHILAYDVRKPGEVLHTYMTPSEDKTPTVRLKFVPPSCDNSGFNMSGLLVQKLNSCWFCEIRHDGVRYHQLPVEGSFVNLDFEPTSRHVLISTRAQMKNNKLVQSRHMVCDLTQHQSEVQRTAICSSNIIKTYQGSETVMGKMMRSCIFSPDKENIFVAAEVSGKNQTANIWNISDPNPPQVLNGRDPVLDFIPCQVNSKFLLGMISANGLQIYDQKLGF